MTYNYKLKNVDNETREKFIELGYETLPEELCPAPENENILFKIVLQPQNGECVKTLINHYNRGADFICKDKKLREAYASIGIKFKKPKNKPRELIITNDLLTMFSAWRLEVNLRTEEVYFTISDDLIPRFHDADLVLNRYCGEEIKELLINDLICKEEVKPVQ